MIKNKLKSAVCALAICSAAIAAAGCHTEGGLEHLNVDGGLATQYAAASAIAPDAESGAARPREAASATAPATDTAYPTHAEARHFAIYNHYRALIESSGSSGVDSQMGSSGDAQAIPIPGGRLFGIEQSVCPRGQ